jgi:hypothetical protein
LGTFFPDRRASESPMAMACLRLLTFFPDPDFSFPRLNSCISVLTFLLADGEYLRVDFFFVEDFFEPADLGAEVDLVDRCFLLDEVFAADFFLLLVLVAI